MNITVGGSFHQPGWSYVQSTIGKLEKAGHNILAPKSEWEPINIQDSFVRFRGKEEMDPKELQKNFMQSMLKSDAYVICNLEGYIGYTVGMELGYATCILMERPIGEQQEEKMKRINLQQIYLTDPPIGYKFWDENGIIIPNLKELIMQSPEFEYERRVYLKESAGDETGKHIDEFLEDKIRLYLHMLLGIEKGCIKIGIDNLLDITKQQEKNDDEER